MGKIHLYPFMSFRPKVRRSDTDIYTAALRHFFINELRNIYWVEKYLPEVFIYMANAAFSEELKAAFEAHTEITCVQITRLEMVFDALSLKPRAKKCRAMQVIVQESKTIIKQTKEPTAVRDLGLISTGRKVDHYEIAAYSEMIKLSCSLGLHKVCQSLYMTMEEEMDADTDLREIAGNPIYWEPLHKHHVA
jgi:ferritin-like metal-binding protein YciE